MSQEMRRAGSAQDKIGGRHFKEGKIAKAIRNIQEGYLIGALTRLSIDSWMKGLTEHLLQLTHAQWIFCYITKHHGSNGSLKLAAREEVLQEVERQLELGLESLLPESQFLLEIPYDTLYDMRTDNQQYWLYAIQAAWQAGQNALDKSKGASWSTVLDDDALNDLPTYTPHPPPPPPEAATPPPINPTGPPPQHNPPLPSSPELTSQPQ
ncbi:hypothetical protein ACHAXR_002685 [Thalassiosira sp. AJA248-18]